MLWFCFKLPSCLLGNTRDTSVMHEKKTKTKLFVIYMQKVKFKFVQINMKQVSYKILTSKVLKISMQFFLLVFKHLMTIVLILTT